jgi:hypothetical protein
MPNDTRDQTDDARPAAREPYEPPAVISEEAFETLALACGKTGGPLCTAQGVNS